MNNSASNKSSTQPSEERRKKVRQNRTRTGNCWWAGCMWEGTIQTPRIWAWPLAARAGIRRSSPHTRVVLSTYTPLILSLFSFLFFLFFGGRHFLAHSATEALTLVNQVYTDVLTKDMVRSTYDQLCGFRLVSARCPKHARFSKQAFLVWQKKVAAMQGQHASVLMCDHCHRLVVDGYHQDVFWEGSK